MLSFYGGRIMIYVICRNKLKKEDVNVFLTAAKEHAKMSTILDDGCLAFDISEYDEETEEIVFFERWADKECLDKHAQRCKDLPILDVLNMSRYDKDLKIYTII